MSRNILLSVENCHLQFGGLTALRGVHFELEENALVGLIGPNGAGKTSVFNLITAVYPPSAGRICLRGKPLHKMRPSQITAAGIARTFQNIRLFNSLSVLDNVQVAFNTRLRHGLLHAISRGPLFKKEEATILHEALRLLEIFDLRGKSDWPCDSLPYGDQRRLEIVRALATRPSLLMLDEPAAGMNPTEKQELMQLIRFVREEFQIAILLVEHDMKVVMGICERIIVLDQGQVIASGTSREIQNNPQVIAAYLGEPVSPHA